MFDKQLLIRRIKELSFPDGEYWVVAGGAMVMHGFRPQTRDIDFGCSSPLADILEKQGYPTLLCGDGSRKIRYSDDIEIFENWLEGEVETVDGVPVVSVDGLIRMKMRLGREKDLADIALIQGGMAAKKTACPCKRKKCPRHGDCEACKAFHADSKIELSCWRKQSRQSRKNQTG